MQGRAEADEARRADEGSSRIPTKAFGGCCLPRNADTHRIKQWAAWQISPQLYFKKAAASVECWLGRRMANLLRGL